jgi:hypothetical protein
MRKIRFITNLCILMKLKTKYQDYPLISSRILIGIKERIMIGKTLLICFELD